MNHLYCDCRHIFEQARQVIGGAALLLIFPAAVRAQEGQTNQYRRPPAVVADTSGAEAVEEAPLRMIQRDPCSASTNLDQIRNRRARDGGKFSVYEPNYFLSAFDKADFGQVKFKISFKYDLGWPFRHGAGTPLRNRIFFAYTQQSFWDLYSFSSPMRDVNFQPMLHWEHTRRRRPPADVNGSSRRWVFAFNSYKLGGLHESNGQEGSKNRSVFKLYSHLAFSITHDVSNDRFGLKRVELKPWFWTWIGLADANKDIADYRGYGQLLTLLLFDYHNIRCRTGMYPVELSHILVPAAYTTSVTSLTVNPFLLLRRADWIPNIYLQHWYGYGESLLNYDNRFYGNQRQHTFRAGIQFRFQ